MKAPPTTRMADRKAVLDTAVRLREQGVLSPATDTLVTESHIVHPFTQDQDEYKGGRLRTLRALASLELEGYVERTNDGHGDWLWTLLITPEQKAAADRLVRVLAVRA